MSKIRVGSHVELLSTSWTRSNYGITDCMPCSGRFVVEALDGNQVTLRNLYTTFHINDFRLVKTPYDHLEYIHLLKKKNRQLSAKRSNLFSTMCNPAHAMRFVENSRKLNKISEKIGANGLKIRILREKIKNGRY